LGRREDDVDGEQKVQEKKNPLLLTTSEYKGGSHKELGFWRGKREESNKNLTGILLTRRATRKKREQTKDIPSMSYPEKTERLGKERSPFTAGIPIRFL